MLTEQLRTPLHVETLQMSLHGCYLWAVWVKLVCVQTAVCVPWLTENSASERSHVVGTPYADRFVCLVLQVTSGWWLRAKCSAPSSCNWVLVCSLFVWKLWCVGGHNWARSPTSGLRSADLCHGLPGLILELFLLTILAFILAINYENNHNCIAIW